MNEAKKQIEGHQSKVILTSGAGCSITAGAGCFITLGAGLK